MTASPHPISPLRQRMTDDMRMRKLSPKTQSGYIRAVRQFAAYLGRSPDTASTEDLRNYQLHLVDQGISPVSLNAAISGLKFFFDITLDRQELMARMQPVRVPLFRKFRLRKWMYFFLAFQALAIAGWLGYVTAGKRFTARQTAVVPTVVPEVRVPAPALVADTALVVDTALVADSALVVDSLADSAGTLDTGMPEATVTARVPAGTTGAGAKGASPQ